MNAPENVSVRSTDLTSGSGKGNLTVKGPVTNLSYIGNFKVTKGKTFDGKDYEINQGTISLNGPIDGKSTTTLM